MWAALKGRRDFVLAIIEKSGGVACLDDVLHQLQEDEEEGVEDVTNVTVDSRTPGADDIGIVTGTCNGTDCSAVTDLGTVTVIVIETGGSGACTNHDGSCLSHESVVPERMTVRQGRERGSGDGTTEEESNARGNKSSHSITSESSTEADDNYQLKSTSRDICELVSDVACRLFSSAKYTTAGVKVKRSSISYENCSEDRTSISTASREHTVTAENGVDEMRQQEKVLKNTTKTAEKCHNDDDDADIHSDAATTVCSVTPTSSSFNSPVKSKKREAIKGVFLDDKDIVSLNLLFINYIKAPLSFIHPILISYIIFILHVFCVLRLAILVFMVRNFIFTRICF
jgi:hypothetical protein